MHSKNIGHGYLSQYQLVHNAYMYVEKTLNTHNTYESEFVRITMEFTVASLGQI